MSTRIRWPCTNVSIGSCAAYLLGLARNGRPLSDPHARPPQVQQWHGLPIMAWQERASCRMSEGGRCHNRTLRATRTDLHVHTHTHVHTSKHTHTRARAQRAMRPNSLHKQLCMQAQAQAQKHTRQQQHASAGFHYRSV